MKKEKQSVKDSSTAMVLKQRDSYVAERKKKNKVKKDRVNILQTIEKYFIGVSKEIGRIKWITGKELFKYSFAAVVFVLFFGVYFYGIDWIALVIRSMAK